MNKLCVGGEVAGITAMGARGHHGPLVAPRGGSPDLDHADVDAIIDSEGEHTILLAVSHCLCCRFSIVHKAVY